MSAEVLDKAIESAGGPEAFADLYGMTPASEGGVIFCGVTEENFAIGGRTYKWPVNSGLKWGIKNSSLGALSEDDIKETYRQCFDEIGMACDFTVEYTPNHKTANFVFSVARLDGPSGVLADHQIPVGNVRLEETQLPGRFDDSERWGLFEGGQQGYIDFKRVALHELLHGCGLGHAPVNKADPCLIEPTYSQRVRGLMPRDKAELVRRYGPSKRGETPAPTDPATGTPATGTLKTEIRVQVNGKWYRAAGPLKAE